MTTIPHPFKSVGQDRLLARGVQQRSRLVQIPNLVKGLIAIDLLLGALYVLSYTIFHRWLPAGYHVQEGGAEWNFKWLSSVFDLDAEMNIPTWYSSAQLLLIAIFLSVFAWAKWDRKQSTASLGLIAAAGLFGLFSCDEVATLHENIGGKIVHYLKAQNHDSVYQLFAFWLGLLIPTIGFLVCVARATTIHWRGRPHVAVMFAVGMVVFLGSAVGFELAWAAVTRTNPSDSPVEVLIEEVGEMLGETLLVWAAWELLRSSGIRLTVTESDREASRARLHARLKALAAKKHSARVTSISALQTAEPAEEAYQVHQRAIPAKRSTINA